MKTSCAYRKLERGEGLVTKIVGVRGSQSLIDLQREGVGQTFKVQPFEALWDQRAAVILKLGSGMGLWGHCSFPKTGAAVTALPLKTERRFPPHAM